MEVPRGDAELLESDEDGRQTIGAGIEQGGRARYASY